MSDEMLLCADGQAGYSRRAEQARIVHQPLQACTENANAETTAARKHGASAPVKTAQHQIYSDLLKL